MHRELCTSADVSRMLCAGASLLLLDCRSAELFTSAHIKSAMHVTIPSIPLRRFRNSGKLNYALTSLLPSENLDGFRLTSSGADAGCIVVYDGCGLSVGSAPPAANTGEDIAQALTVKLTEDGYRVRLLAGAWFYCVISGVYRIRSRICHFQILRNTSAVVCLR